MKMYYNAKDTGRRECKCGSWIEHLKNNTHQLSDLARCSVEGCKNEASDGAHVEPYMDRLVGTPENPLRYFIVPMCTEHNNKKGQRIELRDDHIFCDEIVESCKKN